MTYTVCTKNKQQGTTSWEAIIKFKNSGNKMKENSTNSWCVSTSLNYWNCISVIWNMSQITILQTETFHHYHILNDHVSWWLCCCVQVLWRSSLRPLQMSFWLGRKSWWLPSVHIAPSQQAGWDARAHYQSLLKHHNWATPRNVTDMHSSL